MKKFFIITALFLASSPAEALPPGKNSTGQKAQTVKTAIPRNRITNDLRFEDHTRIFHPRSGTPWKARWFEDGKEQYKLDSLRKYEGNYSLFLKNQGSIHYYLDATRVNADSVSFSVNYYTENPEEGKLFLTIIQRDRYVSIEHPPVPVSAETALENEDKWHHFTVKTSVIEDVYEMYFIISTDKAVNLWIDDCRIEADGKPIADFVKAHYEAEEDHEFDKSSGIELGELTPQMLDNLSVLGRLWGFLKYYHPAVTDGQYNWDYELFRVMPQIAAAKGEKERSQILADWINTLGSLPEAKDYTVHDPEMYSSRIDLNWLEDTKKFSKPLIRKIHEIKNAYRSDRINYYAIPFRGGARWHNFDAEKNHAEITWEDQGYRILSLFRFWNIMEYCFPYRDLTDMPWSEVLNHYLPLFASTKSKSEHLLNLLSLTARIDDSHGRAMVDSKAIQEGLPERFFSKKRYRATIDETADGKFVVTESRTNELKRGDVLLRIEGKSPADLVAEIAPYVTRSNPAVLSRNVRNRLLNADSSLFVTILRNHEPIEMKLTEYGNASKEREKKQEYDFASQQILYFDAGSMRAGEFAEKLKQNPDTKGVIIDLRNYPPFGFIHPQIGEAILPEEKIFLWYSSYRLDYPGSYKRYNVGTIGRDNPDYYKGKVTLLVNEDTQSLGEMSAIALRTAPHAVVIGSTTSGADGNATTFTLPGNIVVSYSVFSAYYPEWELCQRTGVKIDIPARDTLEDILSGRDALIEKAIEYITAE